MSKNCGPGKELNKTSNRCIKKCSQERSTKTGRCIKSCNLNQVRNPVTNRCIKTGIRTSSKPSTKTSSKRLKSPKIDKKQKSFRTSSIKTSI